MARGIDYRERENVVQCYEFGKMPNWAIFAGNEIVMPFCEGDLEEGKARLDQYLALLEDNSKTKQVFTLRVYPATTTNITNKTPYSGSFTFMLNQEENLVADPRTGVMIVDLTARPQAGNNAYMDMIMGRLEKMEQQNALLLNQLHSNQIKSLEDKLNTAISGLNDKAAAEHWSDKLLQNLSDKPEIIPDTIGKIFDIFSKPKKDYLHATPMAGTDQVAPTPKAEPKMEQQQQNPAPEEEQEDLSEAEVTALQDRQGDALDILEEKLGIEVLTTFLEQLAAKSEDQLEEWAVQEAQMAILRTRLANSPGRLTQMVTQVAALDDKGLNKLLNHLD